jgi:hypothetical protein
MSGRASGTSDTTTAEPISKASSDAIEKVPGPSLSQGKGSPAQDPRADQGLALLVGFARSSSQAPRIVPPSDMVRLV